MPATPKSLILSFEDARHCVEKHASYLKGRGRELVTLLDAPRRVLAEPIHADRDFPPFPRATRDGYAVRAADLQSTSATLTVVGEIKAGPTAQLPALQAGQTVAIMTGAPVPPGADAVVMLEHTSRSNDRVEIKRQISVGENIVPAGAEAKEGEQLLSPGVRLDYAAIALAASVGRSRLVVYARPRIAVLSTGDEVVDVDVLPGPNQIRNSNSYSLAAQIHAAGGDPVLLPIAPDEPERLRELLKEGLESDLLLIAGGVSMGKYDLVEQALAELKAEFFFTGAQIQPGKPVVFGRVPCGAELALSARAAQGSRSGADAREESTNRYFLGLPGNPISTMVTFELFGKVMVEALAGMNVRPLVFTRAKLAKLIQTKPGLTRFLPAKICGELEETQVELLHWQGSGDIASVARSNCFAIVPPDRERIEAGEWVAVMMR